MEYKQLEVLLQYKHNHVKHLFAREMSHLLEDFVNSGPYDSV